MKQDSCTRAPVETIHLLRPLAIYFEVPNHSTGNNCKQPCVTAESWTLRQLLERHGADVRLGMLW